MIIGGIVLVLLVVVGLGVGAMMLSGDEDDATPAPESPQEKPESKSETPSKDGKDEKAAAESDDEDDKGEEGAAAADGDEETEKAPDGDKKAPAEEDKKAEAPAEEEEKGEDAKPVKAEADGEWKAEGKAMLHIKARPFVTIYLDRKPIGDSPQHVAVEPGKHRVGFKSRRSKKTRKEFVTLKAGEEKTVESRVK